MFLFVKILYWLILSRFSLEISLNWNMSSRQVCRRRIISFYFSLKWIELSAETWSGGYRQTAILTLFNNFYSDSQNFELLLLSKLQFQRRKNKNKHFAHAQYYFDCRSLKYLSLLNSHRPRRCTQKWPIFGSLGTLCALTNTRSRHNRHFFLGSIASV